MNYNKLNAFFFLKKETNYVSLQIIEIQTGIDKKIKL